MFTWNNPPAPWEQVLEMFDATYASGQLEKGAEGTYHVQGCAYFAQPVKASRFKGMPCWIQGISSKDFVKVVKYSQKESTRVDGPYEIGVAPKTVSAKLDWDSIRESAEAGRLDEIPSSVLIRYYGNLKKLAGDYTTATGSEDVRGVWVYGPPGTGKTHYVCTRAEDLYKKPQNKWWDGYHGEQTVLLDDLDQNGKCLGHLLKIWADKWSCSGEIKGGVVQLQHKQFYVTSNYTPQELWDDPLLVEAINRRFKFIHMPKKFITDSNVTVNKIDSMFCL